MRLEYNSAADIPAGAWLWPHVSPAKEWADHASGKIVVETEFLDKFEKLRAMFGRPLPINSGYRTPEHNQEVSDTGATGPHTTGRACDIRIYGAYALELLGLAQGLGYTGFGLQQKGELASRYIHLDDLEAPDFPRPTIWTY